MEGDLTGRLAGQRLGRRARPAVGEPQSHARPHRAADGGLARGLRQYRARSQDAAQPLAQPRRGGVARALRRARLSRGAGAHHRGGRRADQDLQRAAVDRAGSRPAPAARTRSSSTYRRLVRDVAELYEPVAEERGHCAEGRCRARPSSSAPIVNCSARPSPISSTTPSNTVRRLPLKSGNGAEPEVEVSIERRRGRMAEIVVTDHGPGVPPADRERVLGRFVRLEASRSEPGSGLGLSLVAAVARLHGGALRLEDNAARTESRAVALPIGGEAHRQWAPCPGVRSRDQIGVTAFFERITERPAIYDEARGADVLDTLTKAPRIPISAEAHWRRPKVRALLGSAFSCSPYLASIARRDPQMLADCFLRDPDDPSRPRRARSLPRRAEAANRSKEAMAALRRFKRRIALLVGLADLGGVWPTEARAQGHERRGRGGRRGGGLRFCFAGARGRPDRPARCRHRRAAISSSPWASSARTSSIIRATSTSSSSTTPTRAGLAPGVEPSSFFVQADARAGAPPAGAYRRRLRVPHRSAAPARSRRDAGRALHRRRPHLLRELRPELGARGADQGAASSPAISTPARSSCASSRPSSGANISTTRRSPTSTP